MVMYCQELNHHEYSRNTYMLFVSNSGPPWVEGSTADTSQGSRDKPAMEPAMSEAAETRLILKSDSKAAGETQDRNRGCQTVPE